MVSLREILVFAANFSLVATMTAPPAYGDTGKAPSKKTPTVNQAPTTPTGNTKGNQKQPVTPTKNQPIGLSCTAVKEACEKAKNDCRLAANGTEGPCKDQSKSNSDIREAYNNATIKNNKMQNAVTLQEQRNKSLGTNITRADVEKLNDLREAANASASAVIHLNQSLLKSNAALHQCRVGAEGACEQRYTACLSSCGL